MRIVVTGARGLLAPYLADAGTRLGTVTAIARSDGPLPVDLAERPAVRAALQQLRPDVVVHAAGYTDVDGCERDPKWAERSNHLSAANLAAELPAGASLVYISSDQVYPAMPGPHREGSEAPVNEYGRSKLAGELAALAHPSALVLRTNFFGASRTPGRSSLSDFVADNLRARRPTPLFRDVMFSPLHMTTLATLVFELLDKRVRGVFNAGSREGASKRDFGLMVAAQMCLQTDTAQDTASTSLANRARRATDLRMDVSRLEAALGRRLPTLSAEIRCL